MEPATHPQTPDQALGALMDGNQRYLAGDRRLLSHSPLGDRHAEGQRPFAAIIACADSRVSPALIFDLDRGNLFVSRIAGNGIDTGTLGSAVYPPGQYGAIGAVVDAVVPSVRSLPGDQRTLANCVEANALAQARELADKGPIIRPALEAGTLRVVAAVCDVESGGVELHPRSR